MYAASSALVLLVLSASPSSAFVTSTPRGVARASRNGFRSSCASATTTVMTSDPGGSSSSSSSRRAFVQGGAAALLASVAAAALPSPSVAKLDMSEVKGLDVNEVMHLGAGSSGGKATKPLRDCLLNIERVRVSTKQVHMWVMCGRLGSYCCRNHKGFADGVSSARLLCWLWLDQEPDAERCCIM